MSLLNGHRSRRNSYAQRKKSVADAPSRARKTGGNRRKNVEKKKSKRGLHLRLPSVRVSSRGVLLLIRWVLALSLVGLFFFGAGVGLIKAYNFCTTSDYFAITDIRVTGNSQIKTEDILQACGLRKGENSLLVNVHDAEQKLVSNPWIESVSIRRQLPGAFVVTVKERVPLFCARKDNTLYYINAAGEIIAPVSTSNFRSLPVLEIGPGGDEALPMVAAFVEEFRHAGFPFDISQISWIRLSAGGGFELYWETRRLRLSIGVENWKDNLRRIASVVTDIEKRKETVMVTSIRAADGQVWMTKATKQE
ncbi:cell division protein FtsQ/DivIB [Mailhella sp.]|uniref:cell division protein FtsQ/DivIB n=1 Tax=Mailhella sp. TaxID=1981029 RepID=UPI003AB27826